MKKIRCEYVAKCMYHRKGREEHLHQVIEINYFKIKVVTLILNVGWNFAICNGQV